MNKEKTLINHQPLGAQVLTYQDFFYLSSLVLNDDGPQRGGVPILFPQFADRGNLSKHGLVRNLPWQLLVDQHEGDDHHLTYQLEMTPQISHLWPYEALLQIRVIAKGQEILMELVIENTGKKSFSWSGGLHPYIRVKNLLDVKIAGLQGVMIQDKYRLEHTSQNNELVQFNGESFETLFLSNDDLQVIEDGRTISLSSKGFTEWMIWNPGAKEAEKLSDLPPHAWAEFICIEPVIVSSPSLLDPGRVFKGSFALKVEPK